VAGRPQMADGLSSYAVLLAVYAALCMRPLNLAEARRLLMVNSKSLSRALKKLVEHNVIVQQKDGRYRVVVMLVLPEMPRGKVPQLLPSDVEAAGPQPLKKAVRDNAILAAAPELRPVIVPEPQKIATFISDRARMLGEKLKMPASKTLGELNTGPLGRCACGVGTPFKYGKVPMCPLCARK